MVVWVAAVQAVLADGTILERVQAAMPGDPKLMQVWGLDGAPALVKAQLWDFMVDGSLVHFWGLVHVPDDKEVKHLILKLYHDSILAGHLGCMNMLALVARNHYWPCMSEFVHRYVDGCKTCQRIKPWHQKPFGPLQLLEVLDGP